ncbi:MAG: hypothetical protein ABR974_08100 [Bacteroidales bacterium]
MIPFILLVPAILFSQEEKQSGIIISVAEELTADENDPQSAENFADLLRTLIEDPVAINSADEREISRLFFLTGFQVKILCDYVVKNGRILSIYEIANIPGFDEESARMLIPFVTIKGDIHPSDDSLKLHHSLVTNFIVKPGSGDHSSTGSQWKMLTRYRMSAGKFSGGFTMEKDQGEKLFTGKPPIPDFLSANLSFRGKGFIKRIILGDFSARYGQGITLNSGSVCGYSLSAPVNLSGRDEIRPYTSSDENNFFRGIAAVTGTENSDFSIFLSCNRIDATLTDSSDNEETMIKSLYKTGVHNSSSEIRKKDDVKEYALGINFSHSFRNLNAGILFSESRFSIPFSASDGDPADLYSFIGRNNILYSAYYSLLARKFIFAGELSYGGIKRYGFVQNIAFRPSDRLIVNLICRRFTPLFISFHGRVPVSGSSTGNEEGITGSFSFEAARFLFINAGTDLRIYPWIRYRCSAPSSAVRHEVRLRYLPSERLNFEILYSHRSSVTDCGQDSGIALPSEPASHSFRIQARFVALENLTITTRIDYRSFSPGAENGISLLQDVALKLKKMPVTLWIRYCIFSTDSYNTAIYTWENDLLYGYSVPALYGKGSRMYAVIKWEFRKKAEIRFKYGITSSITEGPESKYSEEFKFQFVLKL